MDNSVNFSQRREPGEIIQATFAFLRSEYKNLFRLTAIYILPFMILFAIAQVLLQIKISDAARLIPDTEPELLLQELGRFYGNFMIIIFFNTFVLALFAALIYSYIAEYLDKGHGHISDAVISAQLYHHSARAILAAITVTVLSLTGLMFFILPGILIANSLSLAVFISVFEKRGTLYAISRSWALVRRQWWVTLSLNAIGVLFIWLASITATLPVYLHGLFTVTDPDLAEVIPQWRWWVSGVSIVVSSMAAVFPIVFMAFHYFNLREREKEVRPL
ncbi:MAG: hypothetical protein ACOZDD_16210 [Bacteroidota bacterium]